MMSCARASSVDYLAPYLSRIPFVHMNGFSRIWHNRTWLARAPAAWMINYHQYHLYTYIELQSYRIQSRSILKYDKTMRYQWSACKFMKIYHAGMCYILIDRLCLPIRPNLLISLLHYLKRIAQPTKLTVLIRYANQVISPHIQKIENWNESIMLLFFQCTTYPKSWKLK